MSELTGPLRSVRMYLMRLSSAILDWSLFVARMHMGLSLRSLSVKAGFIVW